MARQQLNPANRFNATIAFKNRVTKPYEKMWYQSNRTQALQGLLLRFCSCGTRRG